MPMNQRDYPADWPKISLQARTRAGWHCELCPAKLGRAHWKTGSRVILTIHHIDGNRKNNTRHNLICLCQRCHLRLDRAKHITKRRARRIGGYQEVIPL